jgi:hypothetical protein
MIPQLLSNAFLEFGSFLVVRVMFFFHVIDEGEECAGMDSSGGVSSVAEFAAWDKELARIRGG